MRLVFEKADIVDGINTVIKAVSTRTTMPILSCILIEADENEIKLSANDMELAIETKVIGGIAETGTIAVDAKLFSDIIRKLPEGTVTFVTEGEKISIRCGKAHFDINGRGGEDFIHMPAFNTNEYICISEFTLKELVRQTIFSVAANDNNKIMTGELFSISGDTLKVVSLDGHRISMRNIKLREEYEDKKVIVPGKTLNEISRIIPGDAEKDVYIYFSNNYIIFEYGDTVVLSRLIDGEYFKVERMISRDYETKIVLDRKDMLEAIDRSLLLVRETDKKPIVFNISDGCLELSINSVIGSWKEELDIEKEGRDLMIGFNPRFIGDALRAVDDEKIEIYMSNVNSPCYIKDSEESYLYLILPIKFVA